MGELIELTTWPGPRQEAIYRMPSDAINFEVKAEVSAAIGLSKEPDNICDVWVVIGRNNQTWIKTKYGRGITCDTPNILSGEEYRRFWISLWDGCIHLGRDDDRTPLLSYATDIKAWTTPSHSYVTFAPGYNNTLRDVDVVHWRFELPPQIETPRPKLISGGDMHWVFVGSKGRIPETALIGGIEGHALYIIRAYLDSHLIPGKLASSQRVPQITYDGEVHEKEDYEVLCGFDCIWVPTFEDKIPINAVEGGYKRDLKENNYIGRVLIDGHLIPGVVQPSDKVCHVLYNGVEVSRGEYEILVTPNAKARYANKVVVRYVDGDFRAPSSDDEASGDYYDNDDGDIL